MQSSIVRTEKLSKTYETGETEVQALKDASISIECGEVVAIIGASGSGKSTLLHLIGGIDRPTEGKVFIEEQDIYAYNDEELSLLRRRRIGFVFQMYNLMPQLNVYENVVLPLGLDGRTVDKPRIESLLEDLGLSGLQQRLPNQLSGGQQQRVAIARALATQPAILLADEPTGNLDSRASEELLTLLRTSVTNLGQTMAIVTHDEKVAQFCDRLLRIEDGLVSEG